MTEHHHAAAPKKRTGRRLAEDPQPNEPEWVTEARQLRRSERWSYQHIADHLGKSYRQVYKALNYERVRATDKKYRQRHVTELSTNTMAARKERAPDCEVCGRRLSRPNVKAPICRWCRIAEGQRRRALIAGLALAGWTPTQIAQEIGSTPQSVGTAISQMREAGMPLPRHRPPRKKVKP